MQKPGMSSVQQDSVDGFLKTVLRSGVLQRGQLQEALRSMPLAARHDPEAVADFLIGAGKLSRFQADKLLKGMAVGLVLGPFHVLAPIGKGGMGTVYLARDSRSQQMVALKVLPPKRAREERLLSRFRREMDMCRRVAHPHLAWTYDVGVCQGVHYIALEYIPGKSLYQLVTEHGPLEVPRAARLFAEVASALDHAHNQGLVHRDLKPSNIIVTPHDHAKVLDLGLALVQGEAPADREVVGGQGYVVGTMDYLAPEQAENAARVDARSDIYSLGCTLYFVLTGQPPFPGGTPLEKIQRHRSEEPAPVPQLNPNVPPAFIGLLRKMMAKNPEQRLESAALVQEKLVAWASRDRVLPLDQQGDQEYRAAVAALETAEAPPELIAEVIPVGIPVQPRPRRRMESIPSSPLVRPLPQEPEPAAPLWTRPALLIGIGVGLLTIFLLAGLLYLFFKH
jgi:eukaryotic-like serine/threonine-protein kinase